MGLHSDSVTLLRLLEENGEEGEPTIAEAREAEVMRHRRFDLPPEPVREVSRLMIPGPEADIPVIAYIPEAPPEGILVHFHGGGWSLGSPEVVDPQVRALANRGRCVVLSVDYRLAPEEPYPAGLDDAYAAAVWAGAHTSHFTDQHLAVVVGGSSSGANLAAAVSLMARDRDEPVLAGQLLIYPALSRDADTASRLLPTDQVLITEEQLMWFWGKYLDGDSDPSHPYVSPLQVSDPSGLPPAVIATAEYDILRDEGEEYARRLREARVPTTVRRFEGLLHAFLAYAKVMGPADEALDWISGRLRQLFANELTDTSSSDHPM